MARDPEDISMLEIIESLEGRLEISHCLLDSRRCNDHRPECALHKAWSHGRAAAINALDSTSLADTFRREQEIARINARSRSVRSRSAGSRSVR